jgi:hypothetical protein
MRSVNPAKPVLVRRDDAAWHDGYLSAGRRDLDGSLGYV